MEDSEILKRPSRQEFLVFGKPELLQPEIDEVVETLKSGWIGTGPRVAQFEQDFAAYVNVPHAMAVNSCTAGLHLALLALGIGEGDEVITSPMTFAATANTVLHVGAMPVLADIDRATSNIDPQRVEDAITPRTKAIIPVHFAGRPCDMVALRDIADRHGLYLIEDAAHAVGATVNGVQVGALGDLAAFSFYATKNVVTGDGGMVTTGNQEWAEAIQVMRLHGLSRDAWKRFSASGYKHYEVQFPGFKYNMTDMEAALGIHQLARLEQGLVRRAEIWKRYDEAFQDLPVFTPPAEEPNTRHALHLYTLLVDIDAVAVTRDEVLTGLQAENIGSGVHYIALHLQPYYRTLFDYQPLDFPEALFVSDRTLSLPFSTALTDDDVEDVIASVHRIFAHAPLK